MADNKMHFQNHVLCWGPVNTYMWHTLYHHYINFSVLKYMWKNTNINLL